MTEQLNFHFSLSFIGEGNGNPLQCSCLENPSVSLIIVNCTAFKPFKNSMCLIKWPPNLKTIGSSLELHPWRSSDKPGIHTYQDDTKETGIVDLHIY